MKFTTAAASNAARSWSSIAWRCARRGVFCVSGRKAGADTIGSLAQRTLDPMDDDPSVNFFAGPYIDRRGDARENAAWLAEAAADPATRYVIAHGTTQL